MVKNPHKTSQNKGRRRRLKHRERERVRDPKMNSGYLRNGAKTSIQRVLLERPTIKDYYFLEGPQLILSKQQQSRTYARWPVLLKKFKETAISPWWSFSFSSLPSWNSGSSSIVKKNGFIGWYLGMIKSHPILTKSITSGSIYTAADLTSQTITLTSDSYDLRRTLRMGGYGLLLAGPTMHFWFNFVSRVLPKRDVFTTLKKIFAAQVLYGPVMTVIFFSLNAGLQGENGYEIAARLKRDLLPTMRNGLLYWPMCDFVTFKFIPVQLQPLMSNSFSYLWTIYITYMASLKKVDPSKASAD